MWIDFEGIDGSGKTTLSATAARWLRERGFCVTHARENGRFRSQVVARIRDLTRDAESVFLSPETELLLNSAREAQVLAEEIRPALSRGEIVITDRALHSHVAVACFVRGLSRARADAVAEAACGGLWPDLVIYVDVDPDVARLRKRMRKICDRQLGSSGRKGLLGQSFSRLSRRAFLSMAAADPRRWRLFDNSFRTLGEANGEVQAILCAALGFTLPPPRPAPPPLRVVPAGTPVERTESFFEFAEGLSKRDAALGLLYVAGIDHPRADVLRAAGVEKHPDIVAWSVSGMTTPGAWEVRRRTATEAPYHVARGLNGLSEPAAWALRGALEVLAPDQVLHSLGGLPDPEAHRLRDKLWDASPEEALHSIAGLEDASSWAFRMRAMRKKPSAAVAESLAGIGQELAWQMRDNLRPLFPLSVLRSVRRISDDRAWRMRAEMAKAAPRVVMETMSGSGEESAERLRDALQETCPEEVAASLSGLDTPEAWRRRDELADIAPAGVLDSLRGMAADPRAAVLTERVMARGGEQPRLARKAALLQLQGARVP